MDSIWFIGLLVLIIATGVILLVVSRKQRQRWLISIYNKTSGLAAGDTSSFSESGDFPVEYRPLIGEICKVASLLKNFAEGSQVTAGQVSAAVEQMNVTIDNTTQVARDFTRVESVAQSLAQISAELRQEARDNEQSVDSCREALSTARQFMDMIKVDSAMVGEQVVNLKTAVQKVDQIIGIIGEISDRTRLLAFNAAIEAARAGEHGKGFAVVAQEVKSLSESTTTAVQDTGGILRSLGKEVEKVVETVNAGKQNIEAGVTHTYIVEEGLADISAAVNGMAGKIESSNNEITGYLTQVNTAAASQNHNLEEITRVGEILKKAALMLEESSSRIKLNGKNSASFSKLAPLVERLKNVLLETAAHPRIVSMNTDHHRENLLGILKKHTELEAVWSNRADGTFIISEPPAGLANAKVRQWWQRAMAGENYVSEIYVSAITRKPCLTLSVPIRSGDGAIIGVLGVDMRLEN